MSGWGSFFQETVSVLDVWREFERQDPSIFLPFLLWCLIFCFWGTPMKIFWFFNFLKFIWLHQVLVAACRIFHLCCDMRGLQLQLVESSSQARIKPRLSELGTWSLSHWTTREVPKYSFVMRERERITRTTVWSFLFFFLPHWWLLFFCLTLECWGFPVWIINSSLLAQQWETDT